MRLFIWRGVAHTAAVLFWFYAMARIPVADVTAIGYLNPVVLLLAERLQRVVGLRVVSAFERLMGLILVSISVEMLIRGLKSLAQSWPH
mgnify:CR=1 FL=1